MHRTTVMLPHALKNQAQRRARQRGISLGEVIREALETALSDPETGPDKDPLFDEDKVFTGAAPSDLSTNHDRHLYDEAT